MSDEKTVDSTTPVHVGNRRYEDTHPVVPAIYQTTTFHLPGISSKQEFTYSRVKNPTRTSLEDALAALDGASYAYAFSSGVAAANAMLDTMESGSTVIASPSLYGGTIRLLNSLVSRRGIRVIYQEMSDVEALNDAIRVENADMVWFESVSNPLLRIPPIRDITAVCGKYGVTTVCDNTFLSPALYRPLTDGVDVVMHSTSKYINGHSDVIGGSLATNDEGIAKSLRFIQKSAGAVAAPMDAFLTLRGIRTLALRMERHASNAQYLAERLTAHEQIEQVHYPGLPSHPDYTLASELFAGTGAVVTVGLKGSDSDVSTFVERLQLFTLAESLGGVESLIAHPATMSHADQTEEERLAQGITGTTLRLSVGIEDREALWADLRTALDAI
jgi:cystathionine gamma-lyase